MVDGVWAVDCLVSADAELVEIVQNLRKEFFGSVVHGCASPAALRVAERRCCSAFHDRTLATIWSWLREH